MGNAVKRMSENDAEAEIRANFAKKYDFCFEEPKKLITFTHFLMRTRACGIF